MNKVKIRTTELEDFQIQNLMDLKAGSPFMGTTHQFARKKVFPVEVNEREGILTVKVVGNADNRVKIFDLDLLEVLRGLDCSNYIWC